jgi:hypothetical protein
MTTLDITSYKGKKQRLTTSINKAIELLSDTPDNLLLTQEQYDLIKMTPQLGDYRLQKDWEPNQRIYMNAGACMEIEIAKP